MVPAFQVCLYPRLLHCRLLVLCLLAGCGEEIQEFDGGDTATVAPTADLEVTTENDSSQDLVSVDRKIIYRASIQLVAQDLNAVEKSVPELVSQHGGYLAEVSVDRTTGQHRSGNWQARIPVAKFEAFLSAVSALGVPENISQTAQDVTEEFVDIEARISNSRRLEERILELLERADDEIKDVLEVERELARVRGEIEQMEGRLRFLSNRTSLTTVTIFAREQRDYLPPEAPTFVSRAKQSLLDSLRMLESLSKGLIIVAIAVLPWLIVLAGIATPIVWIWRRRARQAVTKASAAEPEVAPTNETSG